MTMRKIRIEKVTLNIGIGESGERQQKAKQLLEELSGRKAVSTITKKRTTFGTPKNRSIGAKVTLRGEDAKEFLKKALESKENRLPRRIFNGDNFSFGIHEHINLPGVKYNPEIGIFGMDVCVSLERPGFRVKRRRISGKIGKKHKISSEEAMEWARKNLKVDIYE